MDNFFSWNFIRFQSAKVVGKTQIKGNLNNNLTLGMNVLSETTVV
jgi:hypothetical protein